MALAYHSPDRCYNLTDFAARAGGGAEYNGRLLANRTASRVFIPTIDVHHDAKKNLVTTTFELPGVAKEDVGITVHNSTLTVSGEAKLALDRDGLVVRERRYGKFSREVPLPQGIRPEDVKATMANGVLTVTCPKSPPEQAPMKIAIA